MWRPSDGSFTGPDTTLIVAGLCRSVPALVSVGARKALRGATGEGLMDKASASGAGDSRFESWAGQLLGCNAPAQHWNGCQVTTCKAGPACSRNWTPDKKGLRDCNSPICTLSQNGYGAQLRPPKCPTNIGVPGKIRRSSSDLQLRAS